VYFNKNETVPMWNEDPLFWTSVFPAGLSQMQLSSSVSLFGKLQSKQKQFSATPGPDGIYHPNQVETPGLGQDGFNRWVIESKFECPSINMFGMDTEALGAGSPGDGRNAAPGSERLYTKGIWKGFGNPPRGNSGIYFGLRESFPEKLTAEGLPKVDSLTGSLINACGFENTEKRIGEIASSRKIYEAIVAVPIDKQNNPISITKHIFNKQLENLQNGKPAVVAGDFGAQEDITSTSISDMITKMNKYYIPPQMDFVKNPEKVDPFVMYIFEFEHTLSRDDLSYIWQNLMPDISMTAEKQTSAIEHPVGSKFEFFGFANNQFTPETRWMIFKVKQRARNNYASLTKTSERSSGFDKDTEEDLSAKGIYISGDQELKYSYNWPYDFCSLVELAKVNVEATFSPTDNSAIETELTEEIVSQFDALTGEYYQTGKKLVETKKESLKKTPQANTTKTLGNLETNIKTER
jgi:hypothetical protein